MACLHQTSVASPNGTVDRALEKLFSWSLSPSLICGMKSGVLPFALKFIHVLVLKSAWGVCSQPLRSRSPEVPLWIYFHKGIIRYTGTNEREGLRRRGTLMLMSSLLYLSIIPFLHRSQSNQVKHARTRLPLLKLFTRCGAPPRQRHSQTQFSSTFDMTDSR